MTLIQNAKLVNGKLEVESEGNIDFNVIDSDDPIAYFFGYRDARHGRPEPKPLRELAKEYRRGYKDAMLGRPLPVKKA